jgi:hypothetical protein
LVTVASESYPPELLSVNAFRARGAVFGGKLLCRSVALSVVAGDPAQRHRKRRFTTKDSAIVGTGLSPLPVRPPASSELLVIICAAMENNVFP